MYIPMWILILILASLKPYAGLTVLIIALIYYFPTTSCLIIGGLLLLWLLVLIYAALEKYFIAIGKFFIFIDRKILLNIYKRRAIRKIVRPFKNKHLNSLYYILFLAPLSFIIPLFITIYLAIYISETNKEIGDCIGGYLLLIGFITMSYTQRILFWTTNKKK